MSEPLPPSVGPTTVAGRYEIERELGRGGSAIVYLARDRAHDRPVALKVLREELAESIGARLFLDEIRLTARLQHPRIVSVLDAGEDDGRLFFVTPYLPGGTLKDRLARERQLTIGLAVAVAHGVATALAYAHAQGLVHRDVKPANILFAGDEACLADFGIARALDRGPGVTTSTGLVRGTPAYMSPEQASAERELDGRSDVYSLGCVLYEMLAGVPPFTGATAQAVLAQRFRYVPDPVSRYRETVPRELEAIVTRALAPSPADRFPTARALADALAETGLAHTTGHAVPRYPGPGRAGSRRSLWPGGRGARATAAATLAAAVGGAFALASGVPFHRPGDAPAPDTTRVLVLPVAVEGRGRGGPDAPYTTWLADALDRWDSVAVVDPFAGDAAAGGAGGAADPRVFEAARRSGAGRLVRAQAVPDGDSVRVQAVLYDVASERALYRGVARMPAAGAGARAALDRLADTLLLRGARAVPAAAGGAGSGTTSLPSAQAMARALAALDDWDLPAADSSLAEALRYDPQFARAAYWQAQARAWDGLAADRWAALADRATADGAALAPAERALAAALSALGRSDFDAACAAYDAMRRTDPDGFAGWYGYAQCHDLDRMVVRDPRTTSGWRFRRSYGRAIDAYARALELLPRAHRRFQRAAYQPLRDRLFTSPNRMLGGRGIVRSQGRVDTLQFLARLALVDDTIAFVPFPPGAVGLATPGTTPQSLARAVARNRAVFRRVVAAWGAALPRSPGVKEAIATSLEMSGDPSAADTLRLARDMTDAPIHRARLAAAEAVVRMKFALPDRLDELRAGVRLMDSLLAAAPSAPVPAVLASVAVLRGRCQAAGSLAERSAEADPWPDVPPAVTREAAALTVLAVLGCPPGQERRTLDDVASRIPRQPPDGRGAANGAEYSLLNRAITRRPRPDPASLDRLARSGTDYLLRAERAVLARDTAAARAVLTGVRAERARGGTAPAFDAAAAEARVWLALADTAAAAHGLDDALGRIVETTPGTLADPVVAAGLVNAIALRAALARHRGETAAARRWSTALDVLLAGADRDLARRLRDAP